MGYALLVETFPDLLNFLKHIALAPQETEYISILHQIDFEGAQSLSLAQREYVIKCLNANYLYHCILLCSGENLPVKEVFFINECTHYLCLLDSTKWASCLPFMDNGDINNYFKI